MTQTELNQAVARTTGESLCEIRRRGFSIVRPAHEPDTDSEQSPQVVDWDEVEHRRRRA